MVMRMKNACKRQDGRGMPGNLDQGMWRGWCWWRRGKRERGEDEGS